MLCLCLHAAARARERIRSAWPLLLTQDPTPSTGTCTYLVGTGRARALIDTGEGARGYKEVLAHALAQPCSAEGVRTVLDADIDVTTWALQEQPVELVKRGEAAATVASVVITHHHPDHTGGLQQVRELTAGHRLPPGRTAPTCHKFPDPTPGNNEVCSRAIQAPATCLALRLGGTCAAGTVCFGWDRA